MSIKKLISGAHIELELNLPYTSRRDPEYYARRLESEAKDVYDFLKDHRSMDVHSVTVVREYDFTCEHCHWVYDHDEENPECCEAAIREWATSEQLREFGYESV